MSNGETGIIPIPGPIGSGIAIIEWAACMAGGGDLWSCSPLGSFIDMIESLFAGRPKMLDTIEAQQRLAQSHLWQFQALAANLEIWVKNGVPLSTGNAKYRAQLTNWISGTLRNSGLGLTEEQIGQADTFLWRLFNSHIELSAKTLDNLVSGFQRVNAIRAKTPPPKPPPKKHKPPVPPPGGQPCDSGDPEADEILDLCRATQASLQGIETAILDLAPQDGKTGIDPCCAKVIAAIASVTKELTVIAAALLNPAPEKPEPIDFSPVVAAIQLTATAISDYQPLAQAATKCLCDGLAAIATAIGPALGVDVHGIVDALQAANKIQDVPQAVLDELVKLGAISPELSQFAVGLSPPIHHALVGGTWWQWITAPLSPDISERCAHVIKIMLSKQPMPHLKFLSLADMLVFGLSTLGGIIGSAAAVLLEALVPVGADIAGALMSSIAAAQPGSAAKFNEDLGKPALWAMQYVQSAPPPGTTITPDNYQPIVADAFGRAATLGMTAWASAMLGGLLLGPFEKYFGTAAAMIGTAAGFDELAKRALGPFLDQIIHRPATYDANRNWRTLLPELNRANEFLARRQISAAQWQQLIAYSGFTPDYEAALNRVAYRPASPFFLASGFMDQDVDQALIADVFRDMGYHEDSVQLAVKAITTRSLQTVRQAYIQEAMAGYAAGVVDDSELDGIFAAAEWGKEARQLAVNKALMIRRVDLAKSAETQVVQLVVSGAMTSDDGYHQLIAAGVVDWKAELVITLAATRADVARARRAAAAERKLELERERNLIRAAVAEYQRGVIDEAGLTAALLAI